MRLRNYYLAMLAVILCALFFAGNAFCAEHDVLTEGQFSDLCADSSAEEVKSAIMRIENSDTMSIIPLMVAASLNPDSEVIDVLLEFFGKGVVNMTVDHSKKTALMYAAENNTLEVLEALLRNGADATLKDAQGKTAMDYAKLNPLFSANFDSIHWNADYYVQRKSLTIMQSSEEITSTNIAVVSDEIIIDDDEDIDDELDEPDDADIIDEPDTSDDEDIDETDIPDDENVIENPKVINNIPEEELKTSQHRKIDDNEFFRMCSGSGLDIIQNAITNRSADVNAKDYYDTTPLMFAAEKNSDPQIITALANAGANPNAKDKDGKTPLMFAAKSNPKPEIISALVRAGAKLNERDNNRITALMSAARTNNSAVVKALIDAGAEDLADKRGWTALFWAARYTKDPAVIGVLLDAGADPLARAHDMAMPIDHANKNSSLLNTKEFIRLEELSR